MSRHADLVLAAVEAGKAASALSASWRRCAVNYGLDPDDRSAPLRDDAALKDALDREGRLITTAQPYLDELFALLGPAALGTALTDASGLMIAMRYASDQDAWQRKPEKYLGTYLDEAHAGTNGIGTAIAEERPVTIEGKAHFFAVLTGTTCMSAPVYGPDGRIAGCLNATIYAAAEQAPLPTFIQMAVSGFARRLELELFAAAYPNLSLRLASPQGRHPAAVVAVDDDHYVLGATRHARRLLDLSDAQMAQGFNLRALRVDPAKAFETAERRIVAQALARFDGNASKAAKAIGISRSTLYRRARDLLDQRHRK